MFSMNINYWEKLRILFYQFLGLRFNTTINLADQLHNLAILSHLLSY